MNKIKVFLSGIILSAIVLLGGFYGFLNKPSPSLSGIASGAYDIIGSRVGTTTTAGGFYNSAANNGTTSVPINIGTKADTAIFTMRLVSASATPSSLFTYNILGSNDFNCETATTTTTASNQVVKKDINWYSLGSLGQVANTAGTATGTVVTLTNLSYQCLEFEANGSSTSVFVQLVAKSLSQ